MREYAKTILEIVKTVCPVATASFENVMLKSVTFNGEEINALRKVLAGETNPLSGKKLDRFLTKVKNGLQL